MLAQPLARVKEAGIRNPVCPSGRRLEGSKVGSNPRATDVEINDNWDIVFQTPFRSGKLSHLSLDPGKTLVDFHHNRSIIPGPSTIKGLEDKLPIKG